MDTSDETVHIWCIHTHHLVQVKQGFSLYHWCLCLYCSTPIRFPAFVDFARTICFRVIATVMIQIIADNVHVCLDRKVHGSCSRELIHFKYTIGFLRKIRQHLNQIFYIMAKFPILYGQFIAHRKIDHCIVTVGFYTNKTITVSILINMAVFPYYKMLSIYSHALTTNLLCVTLRNE